MRSSIFLFIAVLATSGLARAQAAPTQPPPPSTAQPPPPGQPPPPQPYPYPYPYPYAYPPQPYPPQPYPPAQQRPPPQPPATLPYKTGDPIPAGYRLEEHPRRGLVTAGWVLTGIGYGIALIAATSADFQNHSGWLAVPVAGPWLTLGRRDYACEDRNENEEPDASESAECVGEIFVVMGLILDGMIQTAGGTLLLIGYVSQKQELVREQPALHIAPTRVGSGYGIGVSGGF